MRDGAQPKQDQARAHVPGSLQPFHQGRHAGTIDVIHVIQIEDHTRRFILPEFRQHQPANFRRGPESDADGNIWVGMWDGGPNLPGKIAKLDPRTGRWTMWDIPHDHAQPYEASLDLDGNIQEGRGYVNDTIRLHGVIHKHNSDIVAVAHTHPPGVVTFSL